VGEHAGKSEKKQNKNLKSVAPPHVPPCTPCRGRRHLRAPQKDGRVFLGSSGISALTTDGFWGDFSVFQATRAPVERNATCPSLSPLLFDRCPIVGYGMYSGTIGWCGEDYGRGYGMRMVCLYVMGIGCFPDDYVTENRLVLSELREMLQGYY
jgi:hypothetical protein